MNWYLEDQEMDIVIIVFKINATIKEKQLLQFKIYKTRYLEGLLI